MNKCKLLFFALVFVISVSASHTWAAARTFTQNEFTTADSLDPGMTQTGINFSMGSGYKSYYPSFRYGVRSLLEVGAKVGLVTADINAEDKLGTLLGADVKFQPIKETEGIPIDMAIDLGFNSVFIYSRSAYELTFSTIFSKSIPLSDKGYKLTPYGGIELASEHGSYRPGTDTNVFVFGGVEWRLSQKFMIVGEIKTGESTVGGAAIKFEY